MSDQTPQQGTETLTLAKAITRALHDEMTANRKVLALGEDIGKLGGVYRVTDGLQKTFGPTRVMDTPLGESGIIGTSIGMALRGYRPVPEIQFDGFVFPGFNQITSQLSKMHGRTHGQYEVPVTVRIPYGGMIGSVEHHSAVRPTPVSVMVMPVPSSQGSRSTRAGASASCSRRAVIASTPF